LGNQDTRSITRAPFLLVSCRCASVDLDRDSMFDRWFLPYNISPDFCIQFSHNALLVVLSYAVAALAAYSALHLIERVRAATTAHGRGIWLATAGVSMGLGIWAMHFIAILAVQMPIPIGYDIKLTAISACVGVLASWASFRLVVEDPHKRLYLLLAGPLLGGGIALMHYAGIAALRLSAHIYYDPWIFALSAVIAVGLSTASVFAIRDMPNLVKGRPVSSHLITSAIMGFSVVSTHYTAMFGTFFYPDAGVQISEVFLDPTIMAWAIGVVTLGIAGLALTAALVQAQRQQARDFTTALIDSLPGFFALLEPSGCLVLWNNNLASMTGLSDEELQGLDGVSLAVASDRALLRKRIQETFVNGFAEAEFSMTGKSGELFTVHFSGRAITRGDHRYLLAIGLDVTESRWAEARLRESEERFRTIFSSVSEGIILQDAATAALIDVNPPMCALFGYTRDEMLGLNIGDLSTGVSPYTLEDAAAILKRLEHEALVFEWHCKAKDGRRFWAEMSIRRAIFGGRDVFLATARDITERRQTHAQITQLARYDVLTGLANRGVFVEALEQAIARAQRRSQTFSVLYLDLDHFKDVNDTLGHPIGDLLLVAVADRLRASVRAVDTVARFGGDEFAIILTDIEDAGEVPVFAGGIADRILNAFSMPFSIQGNEIRSGTTIGIAIYGPDLPDAETMLSRADVALYRAKSDGRGTYRFFTGPMDDEVRARVTAGRELREAIASNQFFLMYQPQVEIDSGRIVGLEALVRWHHPTRGVLQPGEFIREAERNGLILPLGHWVILESCRQIREWLDSDIVSPSIAVNVSGIQFKMGRKFEDDIAAILETLGLQPKRLELELTETVLMEASHDYNDLIQRLREKGHRIAIDDFGSGYSSLDYLCRHPADRIKVAQSFTASIGLTSGSNAIVRGALSLARELGLEVIVEGVETAAQLELLKSWGCRIVQGFYFARPLSVPDATALLRIGRITPPFPDPLQVVALA
jgi:diguanylate cyclase (GGDEF)-like protein/PAS domain S-box-containing protein